MIQAIRRAASLHGTVILPGDKSISHRYALLASIADGVSELRGFATSEDCRSTLRCLRSLGVRVKETDGAVTIEGRGLRGFLAPQEILDAGNSGATMRLLSGILSGHPFESILAGDESLSRRPMGRILVPLRLMGAHAEGRPGDLPPLKIRGGQLQGICYTLPVASAQVKSCILLAGLYGSSPTAVCEDVGTRDHTEIALRQFGARIARNGNWIEVQPAERLGSQTLDVPRDLSGAAFFLVAAALVPDSEIFLPGVGLNRRRRELLDYLQSTGAAIFVESEAEYAGEPRGDLRVRYNASLLQATLPPIHGRRVAALIDEIPVLSILGAQIAGGLEVTEASELRLKESDRISFLVRNLRAMGASVEERPDGFLVHGKQRLKGADIVTGGDHRIAMAFTVAALVAEGETRIHQAECADVSFPGFYKALAAVGAFGRPL